MVFSTFFSSDLPGRGMWQRSFPEMHQSSSKICQPSANRILRERGVLGSLRVSCFSLLSLIANNSWIIIHWNILHELSRLSWLNCSTSPPNWSLNIVIFCSIFILFNDLFHIFGSFFCNVWLIISSLWRIWFIAAFNITSGLATLQNLVDSRISTIGVWQCTLMILI